MGLRLVISFVLLFSHCICLEAQPHLTQLKTFGDVGNEGFYNAVLTPEGDFLIVGITDGMAPCHGTESFHLWLLELDEDWDIKWQQCYGYPKQEWLKWIMPHTQNNYVLIGYNRTMDSAYIPCWKGSQDVVLWEIDSAGNRLSQHCYGGTSIDLPHHVTQTEDGGYLVAGESMSDDQDLHPHYGQLFVPDAWFFKIDTNLAIDWSLQWGGTSYDYGKYIIEHPAGGYFALALSASNDGDVGSSGGSNDAWLLRLDDTAGVEWKRRYGGNQADKLEFLVMDGDSILYLIGESNSLVCDTSNGDIWVVKTDFDGNVIWERCYGGSIVNEAQGAFIRGEELVLVCNSSSSDGDVGLNYGSDDIWIVVIDRDGEIVSSNVFGGSGRDYIRSIQENKYLIGFTTSNDHDIPMFYGGADAFLMEFEIWPVGVSPNPSNPNGYSFQVAPTLFDGEVTISRSETIEQHCQVHVTDLLGRVVQSALWDSGLESLTLKTDNLVSGAYLLSIQDESGSVRYVEKLVKAR